MVKALEQEQEAGLLDLGCVAAHGHFYYDKTSSTFKIVPERKPATAFLFKLIALLQATGTVPMIDIDAYAEWLAK